MGELDTILSLIKKDWKKCIVLHPNADADACCSAIILLRAFRGFEIVAPMGVSRIGENILKKYNIERYRELNEYHTKYHTNYGLIIIVDTAMADVYYEAKKHGDNIVIIDHHEKNDSLSPTAYLSRPDYTSCVELIADILDASDIQMDKKSAECMVIGMISDTGHLRYANNSTIIHLAALLKKYKININDIFEEIQHKTDISEKIAVLKACQRMVIERMHDYIVVSSKIGAFEGSAARHLINLGADVAFVGMERKDGYRISARASYKAVKFGINLGNIMKDVGNDVGGSGGGHAAAAGMSGNGAVDAALHICVQKTLEIIRAHLISKPQ